MSTIKVIDEVSLHEQGKRKYNEDYIYPSSQVDVHQRITQIYMVCDGVGGSVGGDKASKAVCDIFPKIVEEKQRQIGENEDLKVVHTRILNAALQETEKELDEIVQKEPNYRGMATTLTYLQITEKIIILAWAGDSRIYHLSAQGEIKYRTTDHSLVQQLVESEEITEKEAEVHPRRNIILRAVSGTDNPTKLQLEFREFDKVNDGDFFLLCTDGILEGVPNREIGEILVNNQSLENAKQEIHKQCLESSRDNYSMYLLKIQKNSVSAPNESLSKTVGIEKKSLPAKKDVSFSTKKKKKSSIRQYILPILVILVLAALAFGMGEPSKWLRDVKQSFASFMADEEDIKKQLTDKLTSLSDSLNNGKDQSIPVRLGYFSDVDQYLKKFSEDEFQAEKDSINGLREKIESQRNTISRSLKEYQEFIIDSIQADLQNILADTVKNTVDTNQLSSIESQISEIKRTTDSLCFELGDSSVTQKVSTSIANVTKDIESIHKYLEHAKPEKDETTDSPKPIRYICDSLINRSTGFWKKYTRVQCPHKGIVAVQMGKYWGYAFYHSPTTGENLYYPKNVQYTEVGKFHSVDDSLVAWVKRGEREGYIRTNGFVHKGKLPFASVERKFGQTCRGYVKFKKLDGTEGYMNVSGGVRPTNPCEEQ